MVHVFSDAADDGLHGVVVGQEVEIQCAAHEIMRAVGEVKLKRCRHPLAVHLDKHAVALVLVVDDEAVAHAVCLLQVLGDHGVHVVKILSKVAFDVFMGDVYGSFENRHFHIDPVFLLRRIRVVGDDGILRILEAVAFKAVEHDIAGIGQVDAEIAARLGEQVAVLVT